MRRWTEAQHFKNPPAQIAMGVASFLFLLMAVSGLFSGDAVVFFGLLTAASAALVARSVIAPTASVSGTSVRLRSVFRTKTIPLASIDHAELGEGATGFSAPSRTFLRLVTAAGEAVNQTELNCSNKRAADSQVMAAVNEINRRLGLPPER